MQVAIAQLCRFGASALIVAAPVIVFVVFALAARAEDGPGAPPSASMVSPAPEQSSRPTSDGQPGAGQGGQNPAVQKSFEDVPRANVPTPGQAGKTPADDTPAKDISAKDNGSKDNASTDNAAMGRSGKDDDPAKDADAREAMCLIIESAATANNLPLEFFARVIWQESRFQPDAVGPMTRNGKRAQGVAQFMPGTASERRLLNPFDPVQALPKSAEFLNELRDQFGNLGLAAAAYNAGPRRVQEWLSGTGYMPSETRHYVYAITGTTVDQWAQAGRNGIVKERTKPQGCRELMALLRRAPNPFVAELEQRVKIVAAAPWGVQLAAGFSRDKALAMYARAMRRLSSVIGDRDPSILTSVQRSRGMHAFYQVRLGADTREEASGLCGRIQKIGGACMVLRNPNVRS